MGTVVSTDPKAKGIEGLRVVDASVFPVSTTAHYQYAIYASAEQAEDLIQG